MSLYWSQLEVYEAGLKSLSKSKHAPSKKLFKYLTEFQQDELSTGGIDRPANFVAQRKELVGVMRNNFAKFGYRQVIRGSGLDVGVSNFWELLFAMYYVTQEIEIINNIGFKNMEIAPGVSTARKIPHVEFKIIDEQLQQEVALVSDQKHEALLILQGKVLKLRLDSQTHALSHYQTTDADTFRACHKLIHSPDKALKRSELGVRGKTMLKDLPKNMGFKEIIRDIFITYDKNDKTLKLTKSVELNNVQYAAIQKYLVKTLKDKNSVT